MSEPLCTAIVSTWSAERYLRGCLDDLLAQTAQDRLEILVIDACSPEGEGAIARQYAARHGNIRYVRTAERVNTSEAFNLATELARGRYLTTANTDDRHHPEFVARMCAVLDAHPQFGIAYANSRITEIDNETWQRNTARLRYAWPDYTPATALSCCLFGAQAVWRREVHDAVGPWDPTILRANDHDMFLRIALHGGAVHVRTDLGLFLRRPDSESGVRNREQTLAEVMQVMRRHRRDTPLETLFPQLRGGNDDRGRAAALFELGNLAALGPYTDAEFALQCYQRALMVGGHEVGPVYANNTAAVLLSAGAQQQAEQAMRLAGELPEAQRNRQWLRQVERSGNLPRLRDMAFAGLDHDVVAASRASRGIGFAADGSMHWTAPHQQVPWDVYDGPNGEPIDAADLPLPLPRPTPRPTRRVMLVMYGWADAGGGTMLPRAFAHELRASGAEVSVVYAAARPEPDLPAYGLKRHEEDGVALFGVCNRPARFMDLTAPEREIDDPAIARTFAALLDERRPDVVHFWNLHNLGMSLPGACRARGIPTVLSSNNYWSICPRLYLVSERLETCDGPGDDGTKCERCLGTAGKAAAFAARREAGVRMLRDGIDVHLAVSERVRYYHIANGDDPAHVRVLRQEPPGVTAIWERAGSRRAIETALRRPLRIGFLGSVMAHKGVHVLAQALQALPAGAVEAVALGDVAADYRAVLQRLDPAGRLHLFGRYHPEQLPELLATLDVVVVPSLWDDCAPFVVAEALAARCPVIATDAGGMPDFVEHESNGLLFPLGDAAALAECIASFVRDPTQLGRMQAAIDPPRGLPVFVGDVVAVYDELIGRTGRVTRPASTTVTADATMVAASPAAPPDQQL